MPEHYEDLDLQELFSLQPDEKKEPKGLSQVGTTLIGAGLDAASGIASGISEKRRLESEAHIQSMQDQINQQRFEQSNLDFETRSQIAEQRAQEQNRLTAFKELQFNWAKDNRNFLKQIDKQVRKGQYIKQTFSDLTQKINFNDQYKQMLRGMGEI